MSATAPRLADEVDFPPLLERVLRVMLGVIYVLVLLVPVYASVEALIAPGLPLLDAGVSTPCARAVLNCLVLIASILLLLLPLQGAPAARLPGRVLGAFLLVWLAAALASVCVPDSLQGFVAWFVAGLFMAVSVSISRNVEAFELALHCLLGTGVLVGLVCLHLYFVAGTSDPAVTGAFYQADVAAGYFLMLAPLAVAMLVGAQRWDQRIFYGTSSLLLLVCLVLTYSRGGQIATVGSLLLVVALTWPLGRMRAFCTVASVALVAFILAGLLASGGTSIVPRKTLHRAAELAAAALENRNSDTLARTGDVADTSVTARLNFYRGAWRMALARPLLGWGPSTYGRIFPRYQDDVRFYSKYAHSAYFTIVSESGFTGLAVLVAFLIVVGTGAWRQYRLALQRGRWQTGAVAGLIAAMAAASAHVVVDVDWEWQMLLVFFLGLSGLCLSRGAAGEAEGDAHVSHRAMLARWALTVPLMAVIAVQPFPFMSQFADAAAVVARQRGNMEAAIAAQRQAVAAMPFNSIAWRQLAEFLLAQGEATGTRSGGLVEDAKRAALRAVTLDGCRAVNHDQLARVLLAAGDRDNAERVERQALVCDPVNYPKFYNLVGQIMIQRGEESEALQLLTGIADRYPPQMFSTMWAFRRDTLTEQLSETWFLMGTIEQKRGRAEAARRDFARAVEMRGTSIPARFQLGMAYLNEGRAGDAFDQFLVLQQLKPRSPVSRWLLGMCYRQMGQYSRATQLLDAAYKELPSLRSANGQVQIPPAFFTPDPMPVATPAAPPAGEVRG